MRKLISSETELFPGSIAWTSRKIHMFSDGYGRGINYAIPVQTPVLVLGRAWDPPDLLVSSLVYTVLLTIDDRARIDFLTHTNLVT